MDKNDLQDSAPDQEISMAETLQRIEESKTLRTFPHVLQHTIEELNRAGTLIDQVVRNLAKIQEQGQTCLCFEVGILQLLSNDLEGRAELLQGILFDQ